MMNVRSSIGILSFAVLVTQFGCSKGPKAPPSVPVSGVIKYKDAPLAGATVTFLQKNAGIDVKQHPAYGTTDEQGRYTLKTFVNPKEFDGAVPDDYVVTVTKTDQMNASGEFDYKKMYSQMDQNMPKEGTMKGDVALKKSQEASAPKSVIPAKYGDVKTTDLTATVKSSGSQTFDFELTD